MEKQQSEKNVILVLADDLHIPRPQIGPGVRLVDDLGFDSMAFRMVRSAMQRRLGLELPDEGVRSCETVADLITLVEEQRAGSA